MASGRRPFNELVAKADAVATVAENMAPPPGQVVDW
jgi:hypothetical protein